MIVPLRLCCAGVVFKPTFLLCTPSADGYCRLLKILLMRLLLRLHMPPPERGGGIFGWSATAMDAIVALREALLTALSTQIVLRRATRPGEFAG